MTTKPATRGAEEPTVSPSEPDARDAGVSRRRLLQSLLVGATATAMAGLPAAAYAQTSITAAPVRRIVRGARGATIYLDMAHGPFPARGHSYRDNTTIVYIPYHFRLRDDRIDTVVHFHGHRTTAEQAMEDHQLREQLLDSLQNAILVIPQGPVRANDSAGGKLDLPDGLLNFLGEVRRSIQQREVREAVPDCGITQSARVGYCILSGHSGGYRVIARCLEHGGFNVNEVYLFDALYGDSDRFQAWVAERRTQEDRAMRHKLVSFYATDTVRTNNRALIRDFERAGIPHVHETRSAPITRRQFTTFRAVFIEAAASHEGSSWTQNNLRDCLFSSCLTRNLQTNWFENSGAPRAIDRRQ